MFTTPSTPFHSVDWKTHRKLCKRIVQAHLDAKLDISGPLWTPMLATWQHSANEIKSWQEYVTHEVEKEEACPLTPLTPTPQVLERPHPARAC